LGKSKETIKIDDMKYKYHIFILTTVTFTREMDRLQESGYEVCGNVFFEPGQKGMQDTIYIPVRIKTDKSGEEPACTLNYGMSKRFYAACAAMQGILATDPRHLDYDEIAEMAYACADALLYKEKV